jgi:hypothetical protein
VDTVYLGAFRRDELVMFGGYDESLDANEDFELCDRYRSGGREVWLERDLAVSYEPRAALSDLAQQYHAFGAAKVRYWRTAGRGPSARQWVALGAAAGGVGALALAARRRRRILTLAAAGLGTLALVDHLADPEESDPRVRARACAVNLTVIAGWLSGIVSESVRSLR